MSFERRFFGILALSLGIICVGCTPPSDPLIDMMDADLKKTRIDDLSRTMDFISSEIRFSQKEFKAYAKDNLVLFLADFPRNTEQPAALKEKNRELATQYGVRGFPTVLLLDAEGNVLARSGYQRGGPEAYVTHIKGLLTAKPKE